MQISIEYVEKSPLDECNHSISSPGKK